MDGNGCVLVSNEKTNRLALYWSTCRELVMMYILRGKYFYIPLVSLLLFTAILLVLTEMMPALAPFVYTIF